MADKKFDEFVKREQNVAKASDGNPIDWQGEKEIWLRRLDELFQRITGFIEEYLRNGQIEIDYRNILLSEEHIGTYSVREMIITIGSKKIRLEPVGTFLIGSRGRVDVVGPFASAQLILLSKDVKFLSDLIHVSVSTTDALPLKPERKSPSEVTWVWRLVTRPPRREIVEINKSTFLDLLVEVSNG